MHTTSCREYGSISKSILARLDLWHGTSSEFGKPKMGACERTGVDFVLILSNPKFQTPSGLRKSAIFFHDAFALQQNHGYFQAPTSWSQKI